MPRKDRAHGQHHSKKAGGGNTRRTRKKGKSTYTPTVWVDRKTPAP